MQAKELRIGNFINFEVSNGFETLNISKGNITAISELHVHINTVRIPNLDMLRPIPLTEEWLLRFGFEKEKHEDGYFYRINDFFISDSFYFGMFDGRTGYDFQSLGDSLKHVHQLQNLHFALTGEELKLKD